MIIMPVRNDNETPMQIPIPEQEQFAAVVRRVELRAARAGESERQGEGLFQSLLALSFSSKG